MNAIKLTVAAGLLAFAVACDDAVTISVDTEGTSAKVGDGDAKVEVTDGDADVEVAVKDGDAKVEVTDGDAEVNVEVKDGSVTVEGGDAEVNVTEDKVKIKVPGMKLNIGK
jgi:ferric-dicitrate binding protein FerR (iron transport regulator)